MKLNSFQQFFLGVLLGPEDKNATENERRYRYYKENSEKVRQQVKNWTKNNPEKTKRIKIKSVYGLSSEAYDLLFRSQNGECAICGKKMTLCIDHCHKTRKVRGLLCKKCNTALGSLGDNKEGLLKAINYLEQCK